MAHQANPLTKEQQDELRQTAQALMAPGKGILCSDEIIDTMAKRFQTIGLENTEENRRLYRQMLYTTDKSLSQHLSGVIFFQQTWYQKDDSGKLFVRLLKEKGIIPGIKVDKGIIGLSGSEEEYTAQGLDGLSERCAEYKKTGAQFAKWRCTLRVSPHTPSRYALLENTHILARYASICQQNGLVPILELEIQAGGDHDLDTAQKVTEQALVQLYTTLSEQRVYLEGSLLMPSMVRPGQGCGHAYTPHHLARATVTALSRSVPCAVPGICFLSGGQSEEDSTIALDAINRYKGKNPWTLTFSYGRALQSSALATWKGKRENTAAAQLEFLKRAKANGEASQGKYAGGITVTTGEDHSDRIASHTC